MKIKTITLFILLFIAAGLSAKDTTNLRVISSYILPVENSTFNSSLMLGVGSKFWGVFEFTGNAYLEIDPSKKEFFSKFQAPNVISAGVGMNIPMGGFTLKWDYQRFFAINGSTNELSLSKYTDSYKIGVGIEVVEDIEIEVYHRNLLDSKLDLMKGDKQGFIGVGVNLIL